MSELSSRTVEWRVIALAFGVFSVACFESYLGVQLRHMDSAWVEPPMEETQKLHPRVYQTLTFGHLPVAVDWLWMKVLEDPAISHVETGRHPHVYYDLDLATDLDPGFFELYISGANLLSVIRDDGVGARDLLEKGSFFRKHALETYPPEFREKYWKNAWSLPLLLAYVHLFELNDMPSAAQAFKEAAEFKDAPPYLHDLKARLEKPDGQYEVGLRLLNFMISGASDVRARERLEKKRDSLYLAQYIFNLSGQFNDFLKSDAGYRKKQSISHDELQRYWHRFRIENRIPEQDPWGGALRLDPSGKVTSTTPHQKVFGLE